MARLPLGYKGEGHETIGSDILSVLKVVLQPEKALGEELAARTKAVQPGEWYPIALMLDVMNSLDRSIGRAGLVQMGRNLFTMSHEEAVRKVAKTAADIVFGIDGMYHNANRGRAIGGWKVIELKPGRARLHKTTPHHCAMEEGILLEALRCVGVPAMVSQRHCFRAGADLCDYEVTSVITDHRWMGGRAQVG